MTTLKDLQEEKEDKSIFPAPLGWRDIEWEPVIVGAFWIFIWLVLFPKMSAARSLFIMATGGILAHHISKKYPRTNAIYAIIIGTASTSIAGVTI